MGSIRRHRNAMTALLAEYADKPLNSLETVDDFDEYLYAKKRREDNEMQGDLCQSIVRYARPQKARSASGEWKYIVNTGQHTQTLRLEKCMNPQESCSYLASSYRSHCAQVYNYHRLLSWDKVRGLHVDIFKVPTCCSCQIDGYKQQLSTVALQGFTPVYKEALHRQHQTFADIEDEEDDDFDSAIQRKHHKHDTSFDANELASNKVKSKVPKPTVGSYLSPPVSEEYEEEYVYKHPRDTAAFVIQPYDVYSSSSQLSSNHYLRELKNRRPHKFYKDSRSDQDFSPSEQHAEREVNDFGTALGKDESTHQKRKNIYSVTPTANTGSSGISDSSTTAITASTGTIRAFTTPSTIRYRRPTRIDTNAHEKPSNSGTTILPTTASSASSSSPTTSTTGTTATISTNTKRPTISETHYYNRSRHFLKNQSRSRIPYTITSTNARANGCKENTTAPTTESEHEVPTTTDTSTSTHQPDIYAVNPKISKNHYKTKFSLSYTTNPTFNNSSSPYPSSPPHPAPPKRINYSYHPIIDFFEYNKRITASTTTTTTTTTPPPLVTATEDDLSSSRYTPTTHMYPYKIHKPIPVFKYQQSSQFLRHITKRQHDTQQELKYRPEQNERRIGYGAAAAVAAATDGDGINRSNNGVVSNTPKQNTNTKINSGNNLFSSLVNPFSSPAEYKTFLESNVWHPVIVQDS